MQISLKKMIDEYNPLDLMVLYTEALHYEEKKNLPYGSLIKEKLLEAGFQETSENIKEFILQVYKDMAELAYSLLTPAQMR